MMSVVSEIPAFKLKLDSNTLPLVGVHLTFCLAIWVPSLNSFNMVPQFTSHHPKEEYDALFIHRLVPEPPEVDWVPVSGAVIKFGVLSI